MILIHPSIDPVIFSLGFVEIRWYGIAYVLGFLFGYRLIKYIYRKNNNGINDSFIDDFFIWSIIGVIVGGRIGYVIFYQLEIFLNDPIYLFYIWTGGMSFHGGLIGIIISIYIYTKIKKKNFYELADMISFVAPIGIFFGRLANFINVELYGRVTDFSLSMIYPTIDMHPRHPSQLYEAFLEGFLIFIILLYFLPKTYLKKQFGKITALFLILYGLFRFIVEFLREPDLHIGLFFDYLSMGQILSLPLIFFGIIIYKKCLKIK